MGWFDDRGGQRAAAGLAIRIADRLDLPFHAWSLTRREVQRSDRRVALFAAALYLAIVGPIAWAGRSEYEKDPVTVSLFVGGVAFVGAVLVLLTWYWSGRAADYRDPGIMIDVGADGLVVRGPGGEQALGWGEIEAMPRVHSTKGGLRFVGVEMASRFGRIRLEDDWYRNGRLAAAVVVRGVARAHESRQRAKVEGAG